MIKNRYLIISLIASALLSSCRSDPIKELQQEIQNLGYIPYTTPLSYSGTGTLIGGKPSQLQLIAPPERCFPSQINDYDTELRVVDETTLGSKTYEMSVSGDARFGLMKFLGFANSIGNIGLHFDRVKKIHLKMSGVKVEYLDSIQLAKYYREDLSETCKDFLDHVAFMVQALRVSKLSFQFENTEGYLIDLNTNLPSYYIDVALGFEWRISEKFTLEIKNPKYMGYQLGRLTRKDGGLALYRASTTNNNQFDFKPLDLFDEMKTMKFRLLMESRSTKDQMIRMGELPKNYIRPW